jgi:thymidylate synthase
MNKLDQQYTDLLRTILEHGVDKKDRTGTGTKSIFGYTIRHNMKDGFPLLTTKRMPFKTIVTELLWFLRGDTNIKYLVDNNCHIWDGDAYKNYINNPAYKAESVADLMSSQAGQLVKCSTQEEFINKIKTDDEFAKKWGELGPIYGKQWRNWQDDFGPNRLPLFPPNNKIDQISNLINDLKTNPDSRRLMVNAWNVGELDQMVLPPCHYGFQVYTRELSLTERRDLVTLEKYESVYNGGDSRNTLSHSEIDQWGYPTRAISLMWNQRSVDTFLGLPFNIASYGLLLEIIAKEVNMVPDQLIGNLGDVHLYSNHIEQAKEQIGRYLTDEERYNIWFNNNYETGMERFFDPNKLPDYDNEYYESTPKRTREPFPLPTLKFVPCPITGISMEYLSIAQFEIENYQSHPAIKAPLSN